MNDKILCYFENVSILQHNRKLFQNLCGVSLEIRRCDGSRLTPLPAAKITPLSSEPFSCTCSGSGIGCDTIDANILDTVIDSSEPHVYTCNAGFKRILVPIIYKEDIIGFIFTGECLNFSFKKNTSQNQADTMASILMQMAEYIVKNELLPMNMHMADTTANSHQSELLNKAIKYIRKNYHLKTLTLKDVADNTGISYHYLSRMFKKETALSFGQFRNQVRLEAAQKMLKNKQLSVSQIAYACGFDDPAYFSKVFKTAYGTAPVFHRNFDSSTVKKPNPIDQLISS